jgi:type I restriction enzyme S subunit
MARWPMVALGEVAPLVRRSVEIDPDASYTEIGVRSFLKGIFHRRTLKGCEFEWQNLFRVHAGDLVVSNLMAWERAIGLASDQDAGCVGNHRMLTCETDRSRVVPGYLHYFFHVPAGYTQLASASPGSIARNKTLSSAGLAAVRVPLPPLEEQRRIVARLDAVSVRLKARAEVAERQEAELAGMLQQAFARITAGSPRARMADVAPLVRREVTIEPETLYTEIGIRSFFRGMFARRTIAGAEFTWQSLYRIEPGDVVFSNLMAWERGIALADAAHAGCVGNHRMLTCAADRARLLPGFLFFYFTTREGFSQIEAASPGSIARNKTLSPQGLAAIEVPLPSMDAQQWFEALRMKADALRALNAAAAEDAAALLPAMLHQTFEGTT